MITNIQILRGIAACLIVVFHSSVFVNARIEPISGFSALAFGVDIFFVISGFIMATVTRDESWAKFLLRRFLRIAPLYWGLTVFYFLLLQVLPSISDTTYSVENLLGSLLFIDPQPIVYVGWTLNFEMLFYSIMAIGIACRSRLLVTGAIVLVIPLFIPNSTLVYEFLFGMLISKLPRKFGAFWMFAGLALLFLPAGPRFLSWGLPAALIVYGSLSVPQASWTPSLFVGDASYSIYLGHIFVIPALGRLLHLPAIIELPILVMASVAFGGGLYLAFERPAHRLVRSTLAGIPTRDQPLRG